MGERLKMAIQAIVLAVLIGLLLWHAISWHAGGQQADMFEAIGEGGSDTAKAVLYNLGLISVLGLLLALFMERVTDLLGYHIEEIDHSENAQPHNPQGRQE